MPTTRRVRPTAAETAGQKHGDAQTDWRQQLFNDGASGPVTQVSLPAEAITRLHGIMFDIDPGLFRPEVVPDEVRSSPARFYNRVVAPWLERHPALQGAEVIDSGRGLHVIPRFTTPVEFATDADRQRWAGIVRAVQAALPTDPHAPGITALTRPVGSINGRNGANVKRLRAGKPCSVDVVLALFKQLRDKPFETVTRILFGSTRVSPCPICAKDGTTLAGLDRVGVCYGGCGKVRLQQLYDAYLAPRRATAKNATVSRTLTGGADHGQE